MILVNIHQHLKRMKQSVLSLTSILTIIFFSCSASLPSEEYQQMNLKGKVKRITESLFHVDYINDEIIKKEITYTKVYEFDKNGRLLSEITSGPEGERVRIMYELNQDTLFEKRYYRGVLENDIACKILNKQGVIISTFTLSSNKISSFRTIEYTNQNKKDKIINWHEDGFIESISKYIYDSNGFLVRINSCNAAGDSLWTLYNIENDNKGNPIKQEIQLVKNGRINIMNHRYNEYKDEIYSSFNNWWEWQYKYTYDEHNNWITQLKKTEDGDYQYTEREYVYY